MARSGLENQAPVAPGVLRCRARRDDARPRTCAYDRPTSLAAARGTGCARRSAAGLAGRGVTGLADRLDQVPDVETPGVGPGVRCSDSPGDVPWDPVDAE